MRTTASRILRVFVTGVLAALPLSATILIVVWAVRLLLSWIGPNSVIGGLLSAIGLGVGNSLYVSYLLGVFLMAAGIFALGLLVRSRWQSVLQAGIDAMVQRIPLVRNIYDLVTRFVDLLHNREKEGLKSMSPVWCHFGGPGGAAALGLLSSPEPVQIGELDYLAVLVPTAPVPVGGGLLYVPAHWVTPADVGVDGLTSIYVSMGVTSRQHLGAAAVAARARSRSRADAGAGKTGGSGAALTPVESPAAAAAAGLAAGVLRHTTARPEVSAADAAADPPGAPGPSTGSGPAPDPGRRG